MKYLASKNMSLACFFLNCFFAASAFYSSDFIWSGISLAFAGLCFYNYTNCSD